MDTCNTGVLASVDAYVQALILELCAPPLIPTPAVLWRCAGSARFLRGLVRQVHSRRCNLLLNFVHAVGGNESNAATLEGADHDLGT